ncbi:hypothetical protein [Janthinobacterium aquaticum]|uniref:hypothetical protein n=1 Tax=Janthinobacterium sp. FT58W TaxID=2654254 RepID=UPI001265A0F8|nr:hypothetical protein [Janthinobacterium sp. FT58W]KAB8041336.1 hypothetical protein GCM43_18055 [Janthinobacterium sp. FT58W]
MPIKYVGCYEIDYTAERLRGCGTWGAYVAIYTQSPNPMHRYNVSQKQRVHADHLFATEAEAEQQAADAAKALVEHRQQRYSTGL